jgi:signal transduction histidine kinase
MVVDYGAEDGRSYEGSLVGSQVGDELLGVMAAGRSRLFDRSDPQMADTAIGCVMDKEGLRHVLIVPLVHQGEVLGVLLMSSVTPSLAGPAVAHLAETIGELITDAAVRTRLYEAVRAADQLKASFLATVSHELRTPLTSIMGYIEMIQKGLYGPPGDSLAEPLGYMRQASGVLLRLITDILDFSRMEAGQLKVDLMPVDPLRSIASVAGQLRPQIHQRGLELQLELAEHLPLVQANSARVEQVLTNLVGNAIKFTEAGAIQICAQPIGERLRISVRDTGIGIAADDQEAIFQEFRRVDQADRRYGGAGLGLAIARRLIELMGGAIGVESAPGAGSTFFIELPITALSGDPPTVMGLAAHELGRAL